MSKRRSEEIPSAYDSLYEAVRQVMPSNHNVDWNVFVERLYLRGARMAAPDFREEQSA